MEGRQKQQGDQEQQGDQGDQKGGEGPHPLVQVFGGGGEGGPSPFVQILLRGGEGPHPMLQVSGGGEGPKPFVQSGPSRCPRDWAKGKEPKQVEQAPNKTAYVVGGSPYTAVFYLGPTEPVCLYVTTAKDAAGKVFWYVNRETLEFQYSDKTGNYWVYKAFDDDFWYFPKHVHGPAVPLVYVRRKGGKHVVYGIAHQYPTVLQARSGRKK